LNHHAIFVLDIIVIMSVAAKKARCTLITC